LDSTDEASVLARYRASIAFIPYYRTDTADNIYCLTILIKRQINKTSNAAR